MADLKKWGTVLDHPVDGSSLPCLSLVVREEDSRDEYLKSHVLLLPDGFILVKTLHYKWEDNVVPHFTEWIDYRVAEGKFRQSEGLASIEIIWTGCGSRKTMSTFEEQNMEDSGWRAEQRVPGKIQLPLPLILGDSNGRLNVAELCEAWRKAERRWISKCYN